MTRVVTLAALILLAAPVTGRAAVVSVTADGTASFRARAGERNDLLVEVSGAGIRFRDLRSRLRSGAGCAEIDAKTALCEADRGEVWLGDRNDYVNVECARVCAPFVLRGGRGDDDLSGDRRRDLVLGGPGLDNVGSTDGGDRIRGGPGPDFIRGVLASGIPRVGCGRGTDGFYPSGRTIVGRDCEGFGETGWGWSTIRARGDHLRLNIKTQGCPIGLRIGRRGPVRVAEARSGRTPVHFRLPGDGRRTVQLWARRLCDPGTSFERLFRVAPRSGPF